MSLPEAGVAGDRPSSASGGGRAIDSQGMLAAATSFPEQVAEAVAAATGLDDLPDRARVHNVVVLGMGGSGIAGDVLTAVAGPYLPYPIVTLRGYNVPAFVGEGSLVFAVSFSGNTAETVEAATEAVMSGAQVVVVARGGELVHRAESWGVPMVRVPEGIPQPRAGLGALAIPPMIVLEEMGLFPAASHWVRLAVEQLQRRRDSLVVTGNAAAELARRIGRTIPLVYGGGGLGGVAAQRWKTQFNENAKVPAFWNVVPEACHNEVVGWGQHGDLTRQAITLVNLRHDLEHPQVMERFRILDELCDEVVAASIHVHAEGEGELAQLLDLLLVGDFTSLHLALAEGIDPGPVPVLDEIKQRLAGGPLDGVPPSPQGADLP